MQRILATAGVAMAAAGLTVIAQPERGGGGGRDPEQMVERMMERDTNGDGQLTADELPGEFGERMLASADSDGDGALDREELLAFARERGGGRGPGAGGPEGEGGPSFHDSMENAGRVMRGLRRAEFTEDSMAEDLETVQRLQQILVHAKGRIDEVEMAPQAQERYGDDTQAYERAFRMQLIKAVRETLTLEEAILEGDAEAAQASVAQIFEDRNLGHEMFQDEDH